MPKLPRGAGKATTKERAKKPAAKRAATKTTAATEDRAGHEGGRAGHEDRRAGQEAERRGRDQAAPPRRSRTTRSNGDRATQAEDRQAQADRRPSATSGIARSTGTTDHAPAGPKTKLTDDQRRLLGDLFAVVEEHAGEAAEEIDRDLVERAFVFSCERHADQRRASGEDFIIHPVGVAKICAGMRLDTATLCAALLHDTVEDTSASLEEVHGGVRRGDRPARGRPDEALRRHLPEPRRPPGRELPQDDGRDGPRHPGHPDQARRPAAQHADDRLDAEARSSRRRRARRSRSSPRSRTGSASTRSSGSSRTSPSHTLHPRKYNEIRQLVSQQREEREAYVERAGEYLREGAEGRRASRPRSPAARSTSTRSTRR